jgi:hypothetical protein
MDLMDKVRLHAVISGLLSTLIPILLSVFVHPVFILLMPAMIALCFWHLKISIVNKLPQNND